MNLHDALDVRGVGVCECEYEVDLSVIVVWGGAGRVYSAQPITSDHGIDLIVYSGLG